MSDQQHLYGQQQHAQAGYDQGAYAPQAYGQPPGYGPVPGAPQLAHWGLRVGSFLLDMLVAYAPLLVLGVMGAVLANAGSDGLGTLLIGAGYVGTIAVAVWNTVVRQGRTGQSIGKSTVGTRLLLERNGQPLGPGMTFVRQLAHVLDGWSLMLGYLWPIWDRKRQTFADKVTGSLVVRA